MHAIDNSTGSYAFAYAGDPAWHKLGKQVDPNQSLEQWQIDAGMLFAIERRPLLFPVTNEHGQRVPRNLDNLFAHVRNDTQQCIGTGSKKFNLVQPREILEFFRNIVSDSRYTIETVGVLDGGARYWALAKANIDITLGNSGRDKIAPYLMLMTANDGSSKTRGQLTFIRVVCKNTMQQALDARGEFGFSISHASKFDPIKMQRELGLLDNGIEKYASDVDDLTQARWTTKDTAAFFASLYVKRDETGKITNEKHAERTVNKLMSLFQTGPGAQFETANGTAFGAVNAVTRFVDYDTKAHTDENRFDSSQFGIGAQLKALAMSRALELVRA